MFIQQQIAITDIMNQPSVSSYHLTESDMDKENRLIELAKKDHNQFEAIYNKYFEPIYGFVNKRLDNEQTALDITQDVFYKAMLNLKKYEYRGLPLKSWLYRIASNELNNLFTKNKDARALNVDDFQLGEIANELHGDKKEKEVLYDKLANAISVLPSDDLQVIEMRFFEARSFKEIGEILDITENNAKVKTYRILDKLKKLI